jgi:hypothetical protein
VGPTTRPAASRPSLRSCSEKQLLSPTLCSRSRVRRLHPDAPSTALSTKYDCVYHYDLVPCPIIIRTDEFCRSLPIHVRIGNSRFKS